MDVERTLVTKIVSTGQLEEVIGKGIKADHFADDQCRAMYLHLLNHARQYKSPPSMNMLKAQIAKHKVLKDFEFHHAQDTIKAITDQFIVLIKRRAANEMLEELARAADDPERQPNIDHEFFEVARTLATIVPSTEVDRFSFMSKRIDDYERRKAEGDTFGIPFGFESLDAWTGGIQPHEFVTVAAFSGLGKSTMLMKIAHNVYLQGYTPLYISLEMEAGAILRRFDAMQAGLTYQSLKHLDLPESEMRTWRDVAKTIAEKKNDIPVIDSIRGCNPDHIWAETIRHKPDVVIVDYIGLMHSARPGGRNSSQWQTLTEITQDLKQNCRLNATPIVAAAQTNRSGAKDGADLDNVGGSISVTQDSDIMIGLFADEEMKENREMEIRLNKNRDGRLGKFVAVWDHEKMQFRERGQVDVFTRKKEEQEGEAKPKKDNVFKRKYGGEEGKKDS